MADKKISILGMGSAESGVSYHRIALPMGYMENVTGIVTNAIDHELVQPTYDIFFYNRVNPYHKRHDEFREKMGCKIVMDIDDDWDLPLNHLMFERYMTLKPLILQNLLDADMVTCSTERLAEKCKQYNKNVHVFPNALPFGKDQFTNDRYIDDKVRIFWAGGITHKEDLRLVREGVRRLRTSKDKIKMVIGGYDKSNLTSQRIWDRMVEFMTDLRYLPHEILPAQKPFDYMNLYCHADIMLVPLVHDSWSQYKSNLKILEAATKAIPVICSAVPPYSDDADAPVLWVHKKSDWYEHMNFLIHNKNAREDYGQKLHEWAVEKYDLPNVNKRRRAAFASLVGA
jgi:glycosyltransferase involved in cell wall biosynthesis